MKACDKNAVVRRIPRKSIKSPALCLPREQLLSLAGGQKKREGVKLRDRSVLSADELFEQWDRKGFVKARLDEFEQCDLYEPAAHVLADVLGLDEADAKSLILGRQTWKMYKENNLKGRLPSYRELKRRMFAQNGRERGNGH